MSFSTFADVNSLVTSNICAVWYCVLHCVPNKCPLFNLLWLEEIWTNIHNFW